MATVTRYNGDSTGVPGVDVGYKGAYTAGTIIATGIGKKITAYRIAQAGIDLTTKELGVGGAVEAVLQIVAQNSTILAYQVESGSGGAMSVLVEGNSWLSDTALRDAIRALTSTGIDSISLSTATAVSSQGLKLAA